MITLNASSYIVAAIGILVPVLYALFVIFLTRRGREFSKMNVLFDTMTNLQEALHNAFINRKHENTARKPSADRQT